jgi:hypothetical protein
LRTFDEVPASRAGPELPAGTFAADAKYLMENPAMMRDTTNRCMRLSDFFAVLVCYEGPLPG